MPYANSRSGYSPGPKEVDPAFITTTRDRKYRHGQAPKLLPERGQGPDRLGGQDAKHVSVKSRGDNGGAHRQHLRTVGSDLWEVPPGPPRRTGQDGPHHGTCHAGVEAVRYADGPSTEVEVVIDASVERVWELVSDVRTPARFSSELQDASWIDDVPGPGARFVRRNEHPTLGSWETTSWVITYRPARAFAWAVGDPEHPSATWWFIMDEEPGGVRLRHGGRMGPAPSGLTIAITRMPEKEERIVARRLEEWRSGIQATVEGIKALAEGGR